MIVQLLTFPDCPNAGPTRARLERELVGTDVTIVEIDISAPGAPGWARAWGSPTILIDGVDAATGDTAPSGGELCCRLYKSGMPDVAAIRTRLR